LSHINPSDQCINAINDGGNDGGSYNIYDIYDECPSPVAANARAPNAWLNYLEAVKAKLPPSATKKTTAHRRPRAPGVTDQCIGGDVSSSWLNDASVQAALHVTNANVTDWSICAGIDYEKTVDSLLGLYPTLIKAYKVLVYSGDVDACVPYNGSEEWTRGLGFPVSDPWRPWLVNDQVAGYVTVYSANSFTFLTVKGAGHMVPQYMPEQALNMLTRWIGGQPF